MRSEIHLSELREEIDKLYYPISRAEAVDRVEGTTVLYADGDEPLADLVARTSSDRFETVDELVSEALSAAPVEAIGEPGQSEGDA